MKDIRLTIRAKNNILATLREQYGATQRLMAKAIGVNFYAYHDYENLKKSPFGHKGKIRPTAQKIMDFFDMPLEAIWTRGILSIKETGFIAKVDSGLYLNEVAQPLMLYDPEQRLIEKDLLNKALRSLTQREEKVLRDVFYKDKTVTEIAEDFDLSVTRIGQIRDKAIRKLRHPEMVSGGRLVDILKETYGGPS